MFKLSVFRRSDYIFSLVFLFSLKSLFIGSSQDVMIIGLLVSFLFLDKHFKSKEVNKELQDRLVKFEADVQSLREDLQKTKESSEIYKMSSSFGGKRG